MLLLLGCAILFIWFQLWWLIAYSYAFSQVRAAAFLVQMAQGLAYIVFFSVVLWSLLNVQSVTPMIAPALLLVIVVITVLWRVLGGPALLSRYYPGRSRDVLLFRRPTVDLKRRVRSK